jgi:hypothetical protein
VLASAPGLHRFVWDLRYAPPPTNRQGYPISAVVGDTPQTPRGLLVRPGTYMARLLAGGRTYQQAVTVRIDPRVKASLADLELQFTLSKTLDRAMRRIADARATVPPESDQAADLARAAAPLTRLFQRIQQVDARPTPAQEAAVAAAVAEVDRVLR